MTPKVRPFCDRQVGELRELNMWFPSHSPSSLTYGPHPSAPPTGCRSRGTRSALNGRSLPQWLPPRAQLGNTPTHRCNDPPPRPAPAGFVRSWRALGAFPAVVATTESTTGTPAPGALPVLSPLSPRASGEPRRHARFQKRLSDLFHLLPPDETQGQVNPPHRDNPSCL